MLVGTVAAPVVVVVRTVVFVVSCVLVVASVVVLVTVGTVVLVPVVGQNFAFSAQQKCAWPSDQVLLGESPVQTNVVVLVVLVPVVV